jgi:hypothetical protein
MKGSSFRCRTNNLNSRVRGKEVCKTCGVGFKVNVGVKYKTAPIGGIPIRTCKKCKKKARCS